MRASVIIPARNPGPELAECLQTLSAGDAGRPAEIIVVDDGSTRGISTLPACRHVRLIRLAGCGPAAARNAGARAAIGDVLVFLDADCVPEPGCLEALLTPFSDAGVVAARGAYTTRQRGLVARFVQLELEEKQARLAQSRQIAVVDTACAAYRRSVFWDYGGFDERFPAGSAEDVELSFRMAEQGERLVFVPDARVSHRHPDRLSRYMWRKARFGFYRARLYGRYPSRLVEDGYTPRLMPLQIGLTMLAVSSLGPGLRLGAARQLSLLAALGFLGTTVPLARRARATDPRLSPLVPAFLFARSLAQGLGLSAGIAALAVEHVSAAVANRQG